MVQRKDTKKEKEVRSRLRKLPCTVCGGRREDKRVALTYKVNEHWIMIEGVPASVCRLCGEKYFTPAVAERILEILNNTPTQTRTIRLPVIAFNAA